MTETVICHKTSDGKIFEDEAVAEEHESRLIAMKELVPLISSHEFPIHVNSFDVSDVVEHMVNNRDEFIRALQGHYAEPVRGDCVDCGGLGRVATGPADEEDCDECGGSGKAPAGMIPREDEGEDDDLEDDRDTLDTSSLDPPQLAPEVDEKATFPNVPRPDDDDIPF